MKITEALKTGLPLRRPIAKHMGSHKNGYLGNKYVENIIATTMNMTKNFDFEFSGDIINKDDFFANDWEVKDELSSS